MSGLAPAERPVRYLSTLAFDDEFLQRIRDVSPRVVVEQITADSAADIPAALWGRIDVLHTSAVFPPDGVPCSADWIQLDTSGADHLADQPVWRSNATITTLGGVGPVAMAEYVMFSVLGLAHRLPALVAARSDRSWPPPRTAAALLTPAPIRGTTMAIIGYGRIGQEISRVAAAFGVSVIGVRRSGHLPAEPAGAHYDGRHVAGRPIAPRTSGVEPDVAITPVADHVVVVDASRLDDVLEQADWVVVVLPRTPQTRGMFDANRFARLKPGAMLVNASRGGIVDERAMLVALRDGRLAGAALDVFDAEPLPPDSVWWSEPGVFVTPHVAGLTPDYRAHVEHIVTENLRRFLSGTPLMNEVDRTRGY
jgi:phosphoglycerate dehydrogenase-like enzyme